MHPPEKTWLAIDCPQKLSGMFEDRIHPSLYKILKIVEICKEPPGEEVFTPPVVDDLDLSKLGRIMDGIDYTEVRKHKTVRIRLRLSNFAVV